MISSSSEHYQESDCPFGDSLMVMGEGFSQVSNFVNGNGGDEGEDRKDENTSKKPSSPTTLSHLQTVSLRCLICAVPY